MKKCLLTIGVVVAAVLVVKAEVAQTLYLIGEPAGGWDTSKGLEMKKISDGVFEISVDFKGKNSFGFVKELNSSGDWTAFNSCRYTPAERGAEPVVGENDMLYTGDDSNDYSWDLGAGKYTFTVNTNTMKFILTSESGDVPTPAKDDIYFTGDVNDWAFLDSYIMSEENGIYTYKAGVIRGGLSFKLSAKSWDPAYTSRNSEMLPGNTYDVTTGDRLDNMAFAVDVEDAVLILDTNIMKLTVKGNTSGVAEIGMDSAEAEYFNLAGVKVEKPVKGLYIVRRGAKTAKEIIK